MFETMTASKTFSKHPKHKALYHALLESILVDEDALDKGVADIQKERKPDDADRDEDPPTRPDQGLKRRKTCKDTEQSKKAKSVRTSKGTTKSQPKSTIKSTQAEETVFEAGDTQVPQDLGEDMGNTDEQPVVKADPKDWFKKPERPPTPDPECNEGLDYKLLKGTCRSFIELEYNMEECYKALTDQLDWNNAKGTSHWGPKRQRYHGYTSKRVSKHDVYSTKRILAVTNVKINICYSYGQLEEIEVRRSDQQLYKFMEGDFPRLHLNDIEDMLLFVVQNRLFNLKGKDIVHLAAALQKLNIQRLMRFDELYKFSYDTLQSVRDTLHDMATNLRMGYNKAMPKRRWSHLDKTRSHITLKEIDRQLQERRLMRSLEKFIGGRHYREDLRLLQRTI
ncbi:hypothetical protein Tco_0834652 [Tanacetum coccineum]